MQKLNPKLDGILENVRLCWLIILVADVMRSTFECEIEQYGISAKSASLLHLIQVIGPEATPSLIARKLYRRPHTISSLLSRMERNGLIEKSKDLRKRNQVRISVTEKGLKAYEVWIEKATIFNDIISCLSADERKCLKELLKKLERSSIDQAGIMDTSKMFPRPL
jgi:DNA-binding MarR family transcriptional regulator